MVSIKQIWWRRYRGLFVLVSLCSLLFCGLQVSATSGRYHAALAPDGFATRTAYNQEREDAVKQKFDFPYHSYQQYRDAQLRVFGTAAQAQADMNVAVKGNPRVHDVLPENADGIVINVGLLMVALAVGAFATAWDASGAFDRFVVGLGASRQRYYWWRTGGLIALATVATAIVVGGYLLGLAVLIPVHDLGLSVAVVVAMLSYNWFWAVAAVLCGQLIGIVFAHPVAVGALTVGVGFGGYLALMNFATWWAQLGHDGNFSIDNPRGGFWLLMGFAAVAAVFAALAGAWGYRRVALASGGWLRTRALLWPTVVVGALLVAACETFFDGYGVWQWYSIGVQLATAAVASCIALWHRRRMRA